MLLAVSGGWVVVVAVRNDATVCIYGASNDSI